MAKKIFLMGFMGSGKSTIGNALAKKLTLPFFDLDHEIEKVQQATITEIFSTLGEEQFRKIERKTLESFPSLPALVSLGGGTPCYFDNLKYLKESGILIYLKLPAQTLINRLVNAKAKRPLISGFNEEQLTDFVMGKLKEREPYYEQADLTISGLGLKGKNLTLLAERIKSEYGLA